MKYLKFYYECLEKGEIPHNGLCNCFGISYDDTTWAPSEDYGDDLRLFFPNESGVNSGYWACEFNSVNNHRLFTPLRQTIVLFLAALNGEL